MGTLAAWAPVIWTVLGLIGGSFLTLLVVFAVALRGAEVGVDPCADLPTFDDDEAQQLLETGA